MNRKFCKNFLRRENNDSNNNKKISPPNHVLVSPSQVTITGPTEARHGDVVNFHCITAPSHPAAEIRWTIDGRQRRSNNASRVDPSNEGGWITSSNISITVDSNKRSFSLLCQGINLQLADNVMTSHTLHILCKSSSYARLCLPKIYSNEKLIFPKNTILIFFYLQIHHRHQSFLATRRAPLFRLARAKSFYVCLPVEIHLQL